MFLNYLISNTKYNLSTNIYAENKVTLDSKQTTQNAISKYSSQHMYTYADVSF